jgi:hypothetical protein
MGNLDPYIKLKIKSSRLAISGFIGNYLNSKIRVIVFSLVQKLLKIKF